jgi:hypothetical protein
MLRFISTVMLAAGSCLFAASAQVPGTLTPTKPKPIIRAKLLAVPQNLSPREKLIHAARLANRFTVRPMLPVTVKSGTAANGITYYVGKNPLTLPASASDTAVRTSQPKNLTICQSVPVTLAKPLQGALFLGGGVNIDQSVIFPGALFRDSDLVRGQFTPVTPERLAPRTSMLRPRPISTHSHTPYRPARN